MYALFIYQNLQSITTVVPFGMNWPMMVSVVSGKSLTKRTLHLRRIVL